MASFFKVQQNAVSIVFGTEAAGLAEVSDFLNQAFGNEFFIPDDKNALKQSEFRNRLDGLKSREKNGTTAFLVSYEVPWTQSWVEEAVAWRNKRPTSTNSFVHIIFLADPHTSWQLLREDSFVEWCCKHEVHSILLRPWHNFALWQWAVDCNLVDITQDELKNITDATGNWPLLIRELADGTAGMGWRERLEKLKCSFADASWLNSRVPNFGMDISEVFQVLRLMEKWKDPVNGEILAELEASLPQAVIERVLRWSDLMSLVRSCGDGLRQVDPVVGRLLRGLN